MHAQGTLTGSTTLSALRLLSTSAALLTLLAPAAASAQTWARGTTPRLRELIAVDKTGEPNWPYGAEDIAGDGATFNPPEQSIDLRTAYAATNAQGLWVRAYVSATVRPPATLSLYVFINSDRNTATGGPAVATQVAAQLATDPSPGGYEYLFGVGGDGRMLGVWSWNAGQWAPANPNPAQTTGESGVDLDPIRFGGDTHGYVQGRVELALVALTATCDANIFVRSVDTAATRSDLELGDASACVSADANNDGIPDVVNAGCRTNADCPVNGACVNGRCVFATPCTANADCAANQVCTNGSCVAAPGGACTTTANCTGGLVCQGGQCVACTASTQCPNGGTCAPNGTCVSGTSGGNGGSPTYLAPGEEIQGGACACALDQRPASGVASVFALLAMGSAALGRRRRR